MKLLMHWANLMRWKNLLLISSSMLFFHFFAIAPALSAANHTPSLGSFFVIVLVISTISIAAAGYIINGYMDRVLDQFDKPERLIVGKYISEKACLNAYYGLTVLGIVLGLGLSFCAGSFNLLSLFILPALLLYVYSTQLKRYLLVGNITIAALCSMPIILVFVFERQFSGVIVDEALNRAREYVHLLAIGLAVFAFSANLIREIIKDLEDKDGDDDAGYKTLAIVLGEKWTKLVVGTLTISFAIGIGYIALFFHKAEAIKQMIYILAFLQPPVMLSLMLLFSAKKSNSYKRIGNIWKVIILFGVLFIPILYYLQA